MNNARKTLEQWRSGIDGIDAQLLELLNERVRMACEIAAIKVDSGLAAYDPQRETQVLNRIVGQNKGPLDGHSVRAIFRRIIRETRRLGTERMQELAANLDTTLSRSSSAMAGEIAASTVIRERID
jgi:chorismate mutase/prephenate dehydratase